jgi:hypothetical protein
MEWDYYHADGIPEPGVGGRSTRRYTNTIWNARQIQLMKEMKGVSAVHPTVVKVSKDVEEELSPTEDTESIEMVNICKENERILPDCCDITVSIGSESRRVRNA